MGFVTPKNLKKIYEAYDNWNFQRGPQEVWIFSGITHLGWDGVRGGGF